MPELPPGVPTPAGFTPESLRDYYAAMLVPIEEEQAMNEGQARTSAYARGLEGTPTETGGVAAAQYYGGLARTQARGNLGYQMAGLAHEDAGREDIQSFQAGENVLDRAEREKDRAQQAKMASMGYGFQRDFEALQNRRGYQTGLWNLAAKFVGNLAGRGAGKAAL